jgi:hypothetical protein
MSVPPDDFAREGSRLLRDDPAARALGEAIQAGDVTFAWRSRSALAWQRENEAQSTRPSRRLRGAGDVGAS